jgi:uncharacterized alpha-E superfamily protein
MLSRVAESLYWTGRYVERAELGSRLLHVNFHVLLDSPGAGHDEAWRRLLLVGGSDALYREHFDGYDAQSVSEFMLWHAANPNAVVACVANARENARSVRDQLSSEMWERLNRLHLFLTTHRRGSVARAQHDLFAGVREGSHSFQGTMRATLPRGEAYEFVELGHHVERADVTARVLAVEYPAVAPLTPDSTEETVRLTALLKSCGAFEAFRKAERSFLRPSRVLEYLLLDRSCPRTVLFCLDACLASLAAISGASDRPERALGRLAAELSFLDVAELGGAHLEPLLGRILSGIGAAGNELAEAYFTTRAFVPGPYAQAQQQQ